MLPRYYFLAKFELSLGHGNGCNVPERVKKTFVFLGCIEQAIQSIKFEFWFSTLAYYCDCRRIFCVVKADCHCQIHKSQDVSKYCFQVSKDRRGRKVSQWFHIYWMVECRCRRRVSEWRLWHTIHGGGRRRVDFHRLLFSERQVYHCNFSVLPSSCVWRCVRLMLLCKN